MSSDGGPNGLPRQSTTTTSRSGLHASDLQVLQTRKGRGQLSPERGQAVVTTASSSLCVVSTSNSIPHVEDANVGLDAPITECGVVDATVPQIQRLNATVAIQALSQGNEGGIGRLFELIALQAQRRHCSIRMLQLLGQGRPSKIPERDLAQEEALIRQYLRSKGQSLILPGNPIQDEMARKVVGQYASLGRRQRQFRQDEGTP